MNDFTLIITRSLSILFFLALNGYGFSDFLGLRLDGWFRGPLPSYLSSTYGTGAIAPNDPIQLNDRQGILEDIALEQFIVKRKAIFELDAVALAVKDYRLGSKGKIAPLDIAFGWGPMSSPELLADVSISQSNRFYFWRLDRDSELSRRDVVNNSANMQLIPANDVVRDAMDHAHAGDHIRLKGYLVDVEHAEGGTIFASSMTRADSGGGACEVIYVQDFEIIRGD